MVLKISGIDYLYYFFMITYSKDKSFKTKKLDISYYEVDDLPFSIVHLSDLHNVQDDELILNAIEHYKPEVVAVTGDIVGKNLEYEKSLNLLKMLAPKIKVFFVSGNHERGKNRKEVLKKLDESGIIILDDKSIIYKNVAFTGLNKYRNQKHVAPPGFNILLVHEPELTYLYEGYDIVLSGHAHGGQWRFFGRGIFSTSQGLFPSLTAGINPNNTIISRGLGDITKVPRINNKHEMIILNGKS